MIQNILVWHPWETVCINTPSFPEDQAEPRTRGEVQAGVRRDGGRVMKRPITQERGDLEGSVTPPHSTAPCAPGEAGAFYLLSVLDDVETRLWYLYWSSFYVHFKVQELTSINTIENVFLMTTQLELIVHVWGLYSTGKHFIFLLLSFQGTRGQDDGVLVASSVPKTPTHKS